MEEPMSQHAIATLSLTLLAGVALLMPIAGCGARSAVTEPDQLPAIAELPDPFRAADGHRIASPAEWPAQRRHLLELIEDYGYGHLPEAGTVTATQTAEFHDQALHATRRTLVLGLGPQNRIAVHLYLITPDGPGPFPTIIEGDRCWGSLSDAVVTEAIARGYLLAQFDRTEVTPDRVDPVTPGRADRSVGLYAAYPDSDGGALIAWAWGYQRVIDALLQRSEVDRTRLAITGHSRGGKATLLAGALDERIALVAPNGSGCFGAGCERQLFQCEDLDRIVKVFPFWFSPRLAQFSGHVERLPFDQHTLKALVAPRALLSTEGLDDAWANPRGTQISFQAARVVYRFLGAEGKIGISYRPGKHEHNPTDWQALLDFADRELCHKAVARQFGELHFPDESQHAFTWAAP